MNTPTPTREELLEQIASSWDGCVYEAVGETLDIGTQLRKQFDALLSSAQTDQVWNDAVEASRNWLRRNANAEKDPAKRAAFIEAHNAVLSLKRPLQAQEPCPYCHGRSTHDYSYPHPRKSHAHEHPQQR